MIRRETMRLTEAEIALHHRLKYVDFAIIGAHGGRTRKELAAVVRITAE